MFKPSKEYKETFTKVIYFVRHGEGTGSVGAIRQGAKGALTEKGRKEAQQIADRCAKLNAEMVVSSTMPRARETTEYIFEKLKKPVEYSDLFAERRRPSIQIEKPKDSPEALQAEKIIMEHFTEPGFRFSDEENFDDLKKRASEALTYLANRPETHLLVVTHGFFMRILAAQVVLGNNLIGSECEAFIRSLPMENTGISTFLHYSTSEHLWAIWTWNDHSHLG